MAPYFKSDIEVLNYALTLEHLEDYFYRTVTASGKLQGNTAKYLAIIAAHEKAHVDALTKAIQMNGGTPVAELARYNFAPLGDITTQDGILKIANVLEPTGVSAYNGAAREITNKAFLAVAGQIVQVEARHAAIIATQINPNANPTTSSFAAVATPQQIIAAITPIIS